MTKVTYRTELFPSNGRYTALTPDLNIVRIANTAEDAIESLRDGVDGYLQVCESDGVLEAVLEDAGFENHGDAWIPGKRTVGKQTAHVPPYNPPDPNAAPPEDPRNYTFPLKGGGTGTVTHLSHEDIKRELAEFEAKYGMSSQEFLVKYNTYGFKDENHELMRWSWLCYVAYKHESREAERKARNS